MTIQEEFDKWLFDDVVVSIRLANEAREEILGYAVDLTDPDYLPSIHQIEQGSILQGDLTWSVACRWPWPTNKIWPNHEDECKAEGCPFVLNFERDMGRFPTAGEVLEHSTEEHCQDGYHCTSLYPECGAARQVRDHPSQCHNCAELVIGDQE